MNNINEFLYKLLIKEYGKEITEKIIAGHAETKPVTIRVNKIKSNLENIKEKLKQENIKYSKIPWYEDALIIENAREDIIMNLDIYKNGELYMQSLSSMIPVIILNPKKRRKYIRYDCCSRGQNNSNGINIK